ncbi:hypothetical protein B0H66DRAFT_557291 [Apodospora peruviana]|uniref:Uncharacterized protein n=1 Tax=Apodospora peruviana TaxID=516989 RepID=A0AAE0M3X2_9PEZI|nr:hypothetical protein B0H66DRAFT_557291 [Apodospora peruviana]
MGQSRSTPQFSRRQQSQQRTPRADRCRQAHHLKNTNSRRRHERCGRLCSSIFTQTGIPGLPHLIQRARTPRASQPLPSFTAGVCFISHVAMVHQVLDDGRMTGLFGGRRGSRSLRGGPANAQSPLAAFLRHGLSETEDRQGSLRRSPQLETAVRR